jgi:hypothetical protein
MFWAEKPWGSTHGWWIVGICRDTGWVGVWDGHKIIPGASPPWNVQVFRTRQEARERAEELCAIEALR